MAQKVSVDQFANTLTKALREYTRDVEDGLRQTLDETAKECAKELKVTSPKKTGKYARGWAVQKEGSSKQVVWNKKYYSLVHLLEKGYAKRGGGRVPGRPHVARAEQKYTKLFVERAEDVIRKGGK